MSNKGGRSLQFPPKRNRFSSSLGCTAGDALVSGGAYRDRTDDLMLAKQPLSQLS